MELTPQTTARKSETLNDGNAITAGFRLLVIILDTIFVRKFLWINHFHRLIFLQKTLDANRYATKKTIAQGLLDVALLTANASQLKYVLQVGKQHEFYTLMLSLIIVSIVLQVSI